MVGLSTRQPLPGRYTHIPLHGNPTDGIGQHDTTGKQRPVRLCRCRRIKVAFSQVSADNCSTTQRLSTPAQGLPPGFPQQNSRHRKTGVHPAANHRAPDQTLQILAMPVTSPNRFETISDGRALRPCRSSQSRSPLSGMPDTDALPGDRLALFIEFTAEKIAFAPCAVRSISHSTTRADCADFMPRSGSPHEYPAYVSAHKKGRRRAPNNTFSFK